ncbi:MAG: sensor histidine kinase, partial [Bacteroidota bacterium]
FDSARHAGKVFEPFQRFHHHGEGKGLGMFLVRNQVESLGGTISLTSQVNVGTRVEIRLPVPAADEVLSV